MGDDAGFCAALAVAGIAFPDFVAAVTGKFEGEVPAEFIGTMVVDGLRDIDEVAYVRFASVYRRFQEATDFVHEVKKLEAKQ